ncbi:MAG: MarR family winged helix-turn-helix transcriptional regulator [Tumebacillaceae bacterium]
MKNRELIEQFFVSIQSINRYMRAGQFDQENQPLTRVQWMILRHVFRREERTIGQLAEHLNVRSSTMSQMIDRLEKAELVYRATDTNDARARVVRLTPEGLKAIQEIETNWLETLAEPFDHLSTEEHQTLVKIMKKLTYHLPKRSS